MPTSRLAHAVIAVLAASPLLIGPVADARTERSGESSVRACSRYGNGCRVFKVRPGRNGLEYRSPGGNWIECRMDCKDAVREDVIDFWETLRERGGSGRF